MKQRVLLIALLFYSFSTLAGDTVLKLYRPLEGGEQGALVIKKQVKGRCDAQSHLIFREDAWRCLAHGKILDPCFLKAGSKDKTLLCPTSPWSSETVAVHVHDPLNNEEHQILDMSRTFPWAIELVNGERCQAVEPGEHYDAMPIRYRCTNQNLLLGPIQRCNPVWSTLEKTANGVLTMDLKKVWF